MKFCAAWTTGTNKFAW